MESKKKNKRPKPYDEMSTTGAMTRVTDVPRSYRPIARPGQKNSRTSPSDETYTPPGMEVNEMTPIGKPRTMGERMRMQESRQGLEERSLRSQQRESQDYEDFGGGHQGRPAKKFKDGGKVKGKGFPDLNKDGKVTKADILKGRGVDGFKDGGMVRGAKPGQTSGTKFSGTF